MVGLGFTLTFIFVNSKLSFCGVASSFVILLASALIAFTVIAHSAGWRVASCILLLSSAFPIGMGMMLALVSVFVISFFWTHNAEFFRVNFFFYFHKINTGCS